MMPNVLLRGGPGRGVRLLERLQKGPLPLGEAMQAAIAVAEAVKDAHRQGRAFGQIHPSHIRLDGAAAEISPATSEVSCYTAPEQLRGERADARTDIFALGVLLYRMLSGRDPFHSSGKPGELRREILQRDPASLTGVPAPLARTVAKCLEKKRERRIQKIQILLAELKLQAIVCRPETAPALPEVPVSAPPLTPFVVPDPPPVPAVSAFDFPEEEHIFHGEMAAGLAGRSPKCPKCGSSDVRESRSRGPVERVLARAGIRVRRCRRCYHRFTRFGSLAAGRTD